MLKTLFARRQPVVECVALGNYQVQFVTIGRRRWVYVQTEGQTVFSSLVFNRGKDFSKSTLQDFVLNTPSWVWGDTSVLKGLSRAS